jgi:hypothetical protein
MLLLLNLKSVIAFLISILLIKLGLRREPDAWRRTVGVGLRSEGSKFGLSAFGVRASGGEIRSISPVLDTRYPIAMSEIERREIELSTIARRFEGVKFATAVDVPAHKTGARGVDLVPIRPADYMHEGGFVTYLRDFNQESLPRFGTTQWLFGVRSRSQEF